MFPDYARLAEAVFNSQPDTVAKLRAACDRTDALRAELGEDDPRVQAGERQANELKGSLTRRIAWACHQQDGRIGLRRKDIGQHATRGDGVAHSTDALMLRDTGEICDVMSDRNWSWNANPDDRQPLDQWLDPLPEGEPAPMDVKNRDFVRAALTAVYASFGYAPTARGTGPTDIEYYADEVIKTGGWTDHTEKGENNIGFWTDRIKHDLIAAGMPIGQPGQPPAQPPPNPPPVDTELQARVARLEELFQHLNAENDDQTRKFDEIVSDLKNKGDRLAALELKPPPELPPFELPRLVAVGKVRVFGFAYDVKLPVVKA